MVAAALSLTVHLHPAVLPGGAQHHDQRQGGDLHRGGARRSGASDGVIMRRYLFGNVIQSVPVIGTLNAADAIGTLAGLGFLGLGIQPDDAGEWGFDLQRALDDAKSGIWWTVAVPGPGDRAC